MTITVYLSLSLLKRVQPPLIFLKVLYLIAGQLRKRTRKRSQLFLNPNKLLLALHKLHGELYMHETISVLFRLLKLSFLIFQLINLLLESRLTASCPLNAARCLVEFLAPRPCALRRDSDKQILRDLVQIETSRHLAANFGGNVIRTIL